MDDLEKEEQAINAKAEDNSPTETPTVETKALEVDDESVQSEKTEISTEESDTEGEKKVSGAEKRIHKLVDERDDYKAKVEDLSSKLEELTAGSQQEDVNPYQPESDGGQKELTIDDLRTIARLEVEKERTVNRIKSEAQDAQKFYPELDSNSDAFDPDVNEAITSAVYNEIRMNPNLSVKQLTDKYMKPYLKAAERAVGQEKATIAKQVTEATLRPSNIKGNEKKFQDKSIEEMEQELETVH